jgi:U3 small nucleolar RNA-associated protein 23
MRVLRNKGHRKTLNYFGVVFGLRAPYRVLIDGNFLAVASRLQIEWLRLLPKLLQVQPHNCYLHITECALAELEALGDGQKPARDEANKIAVMKCRRNHGHSLKTEPSDCILQLVGAKNEGKWIVVTQDAELRSKLRLIPGTPIILVSSNVLVLETPSFATKAAALHDERGKGELSKFERKVVKHGLPKKKEIASDSSDGDMKGESELKEAVGHSSQASSSSSSNTTATLIKSDALDSTGPIKKRKREIDPMLLPAVRSDRVGFLNKRVKAPNPLSVQQKKKKVLADKAPSHIKTTQDGAEVGQIVKKRRRKSSSTSGGGLDGKVGDNDDE